MKAYFLPGIGADCRLFKHIALPEGFEPVYIDWIDPIDRETLPQYAGRLSKKIDQSQPFVLIGLSLGGIVATEIAKLTQPACTLIISSVTTHHQLPPYFSFARKFRLHKLVHPSFIKLAACCKNLVLTKGADNKKLMLEMIRAGNNRFIAWGMHAVLHWQNETIPQPLIHIHGTRDEVFPLRYTRPHHQLTGGHMLVFNRCDAVNTILKKVLGEMTTDNPPDTRSLHSN